MLKNSMTWWLAAKIGMVLLCFGLITSVQAQGVQDHPTSVNAFTFTWPQILAILGFVAAGAGAVGDIRSRVIDLDRRVHRIEEYCDKQESK